jgi:hypothetical protein
MKYRKKPVVIEAVKLGWDTWNEVCNFVPKPYFQGGCYLDSDNFVLPEGKTSGTMGLRIRTLEGVMIAREGDYIIKGVNGEFYPCKPDIFEKTYEPADGPDKTDSLTNFAKLFARSMFYGNWKWETANERMMELLMRELGYYPIKDEDEMIRITSIPDDLYERAKAAIPSWRDQTYKEI